MSPNLDFSLGFGGQGRPRDPGDPIRILALGDFTGRASRGHEEPLSGRKPRKVDLDDLDDVFAMMAPQLRLELGPDLTVTITPREIDDLHPDRIYDTVDAFAELRSLRTRLADPSTFAEAAATLSGSESRGGTAAPDSARTDEEPSPTPSPGSKDDGLTDFQRLLGGSGTAAESSDRTLEGPASPERSASSPAHRVQSWIESLVGPNIVPDRDPTQDLYLMAVDDTIGSLLRTILHHPLFQELESAWRSVQQLVQGTAGLESVRVSLLDSSSVEWTKDLVGGGELGGLLSSDRGLGDAAWSWVILDPPVGSNGRELEALAALTAAAATSGTAVAGSAAPALLGISSFAESPEPRDWPGPDEDSAAAWSALRTAGSAGHLALAAPRVLLRLPYGKATDPIDRFAFEEFLGSARHTDYLWGSAGYGLALAATVAAEEGQSAALGPIPDRAAGLGSLTLTELPVHVVPDDGGPGMKACAEAFLTEGAAEELERRGFTPVVSIRNSDRAKVWKFRSVAGG